MPRMKTDKVTVTMPVDRIESLRKEATAKGLSMPTFCRLLLCDLAEDFANKHKQSKAA